MREGIVSVPGGVVDVYDEGRRRREWVHRKWEVV